MKSMLTRAAVAGAALLMLGGPALSAPTITMTSPADGSTVSRSQSPSLAMSGAVSFATPTAVDAQYYLRQNVCSNASTDQRSLAPTFSNADAASCGYNGNITPLNEVVETVDGVPGLPMDFPMQDGFLPVTLDTTKAITGNIRLASFNANGVGVGVGVTTVDVGIRATIDGNEQTVGTGSVSYQHLPGTVNKDVAFSITPNASFNKKDATTLTFDLSIHGVNVAHGWIFYRGLSHITVPSYTASFDRKVQVAVNGGAFTSNGVTLSADGTSWSATMGTPPVGSHFIKAQAVQGGIASGIAQNVLHVTA